MALLYHKFEHPVCDKIKSFNNRSFLLTPKLEQKQTFEIILPNLIHKPKKRNLTWWVARRLQRRAGKTRSARGQKFPPLKTPPFLPTCLAEKAYEIFKSSKVTEKRQLLNFLLQNLQLKGRKLIMFTLKTPFDTVLQANKCSSMLRG